MFSFGFLSKARGHVRHSLVHWLVVWALCGLWGGVGAQTGVGAPSSLTTVSFTIIGATGGTGASLETVLPANFTLWNVYPVTLSDTVYSVMASILNDVMPGATPTPTAPNTTAPAQADNSLSVYWIVIIVVGGAVGVTAIILAIYFGVMANKANANNKVAPLLPQQPPVAPVDPAGSSIASLVSSTYLSPAGGRYTKVIQLPIVCPRPLGTVVSGYPVDTPA